LEDRRLIEETFPIREVSIESEKEKNIRHGHISTLHIWWARRPLAASRATTYAALVPSPKDTEEWKKKREFIARLSKWENSLNQNLIERARKEILEANGGKPPKVLDPFAGGGSIPLEALRLGCETYASDYNPVATLILKCTLEYPQKYGYSNQGGNGFGSTINLSANRLLEDVKKWGNWVLEEARKEIARFYPQDKDGSIPVGYIWARTIPCQNPSCGTEIPLMRQFWLAKKSDKKVSLYPYASNGKVNFKIVGTGYEKMPSGFNPDLGTVSRAIGRCLVCGSIVDDKTTRKLFCEGKAGQRMVAVVLHKPKVKGKRYRIANSEDMKAFIEAEEYLEEKRRKLFNEWGMDPVPDEPLKRVPVSFGVINVWVYGMNSWGDLFNARQKLALVTFTEKVRLAYNKMIEDEYDEEYVKAVVSYLAFVVSRITDTNSVVCHWDGGWEKTATTFGRQALPMNWDYIEANVLGEKGYNFKNILDIISLVLERNFGLYNLIPQVTVRQSSATSLPYPDNYFDAVITDPPYYDNVPYSYLSDFFYVWLKRTVGDLYPDLFITPLTPKAEEIVAYSNREGGFEEGKKYFEDMLKKSFKEINRVLKPNGVSIIVFAHKSLSGWETLINSLLDSGLVVTVAWPIHTEMKKRLRASNSAALASSIYIVARKIKRMPLGFYRRVKDELGGHLNNKLNQIWNEGISGADFFISAIGSSIEVFGKYEKIIDNEGNVIDTNKLLSDVRRIVTEYAVRQVLHNGFAAEIKPMTRFYVLWRWAYGDQAIEFDEARKLGQSVGLDVAEKWNKGFIRKDKEFIRVLGPEERKIKDLEDSTELIDVLHRVLLLWKEGKFDDIPNVLAETGYGKSEVFYRVAQAISESLPFNSSEKKLLEGFLAGKERVMKEASKKERQARLFE
jgi:putative DNA methylase